MKLFDLATEYREAADVLAEMDLDEQTVTDTLAAVEGEFEAKAKAVAAVIAELEAEAATLSDVSKRLAEKCRTRRDRADWLRGYLLNQMHRVKKVRIKDAVLPLRIIENPPAVAIPDPEAVPDDWVRIKTVREPDKKAIRALLDSGERVNWATLQRGERIKIG